MFSQTGFEITFDRAQCPGLEIFAGMDRYRCAAIAALDAKMRADLPGFDASQFVEDAPQPSARHSK